MQQQNHIVNQKGVVLYLAVIMLALLTMLGIYLSNSVRVEQQIHANQYRSNQAFSAANAALDYAITYFDTGGIDKDGVDGVDELFGPNPATSGLLDITYSSGALPRAKAFYCDVFDKDDDVQEVLDNNFSSEPEKCTDRPDLEDESIGIVAVGWSDDKSAQRILTVKAALIKVLDDSGDGLDWALIAHDANASGGNVSVINRLKHQTIWTGGALERAGSGGTFTAPDPDVYADLTADNLVDPDTSNDWTIESTRQNSFVNSDIIYGDPNLEAIDGDGFFGSFYNENKEILMELAKEKGQFYRASENPWNTMAMSGVSGLVWIEVEVGEEWSPTGSLAQLGTQNDPVIMIVNGDLDTGGSGGDQPNIVGILYVVGDWVTAGNIAIQGTVIVEGQLANGTGNPKVIYDPHLDLFDDDIGSFTIGTVGILPGSFKDWKLE